MQTISNGHEGNQFAKYVYGYNKGKSGWLPHMIVSTEKSTAFAIRFHSLTSCGQHTKLNGRIALVTDRTPSKVCVLLLPEGRRLSTSWTNVLPLDKIVMYDFLKSTPGCGKKELQKHFRQRSLACHPDKNGGNAGVFHIFLKFKDFLEYLES